MNKGGDGRGQCIKPRVSRDTSYLALDTEGNTKVQGEDRLKVFLPKCRYLYTIATSCNYVIKFSHLLPMYCKGAESVAAVQQAQ